MSLEYSVERWRETFEFFDDDMEMYQHLVDQGKKLQEDPLPEELRTEATRVSRCQYNLFVAPIDSKFKAYSDGMIASGYAYMLLDIFNSASIEEVAECDPVAIGQQLGVREILSANRSNGFYQMMDLMKHQAKSEQ